MRISVIIPIYNAAAYLTKAVRSALDQPEVAEVILVEDASPDNALEIAESLANTDQRVKVFQHSDKKNHGAGASRNLGIKKSSCDFIAFLDADDFFLPNRFKKTKEVFETSERIDGVYEAIGFYNYTKMDFKKHGRLVGKNWLTTIDSGIPPSELFRAFLFGDQGWWSLDGFTIKKSLLDKTGLFDTALIQAQDTDFLLRTCLYGHLKGGCLNQAVTMRGFHDHNRIHNQHQSTFYRHQMYRKWLKKMLNEDWTKEINFRIFRSTISHFMLKKQTPIPNFLKYPVKGIYTVYLLLRYPRLITKII